MAEDHTAIVVGAGIGGLATAVGLRAAGWDVTVLERAAQPRGDGGGITLWSNGLRAADVLGVGAAFRAHGTPQAQGGLRTPTGRWLTRSSGARVDVDLPMLVLHRAALHGCLLDALPRGIVRTDCTVVDVGQDASSATVTYRTGNGDPTTLAAALVVGADGVRSRVRRAVLPDAPAPRYAGFTTWRGVTDEPFALPAQSETWGPGSVFGLTRLPDGRLYWYATATEPAGTRADDEHAEVLRRFGGWHTPIADVVRSTTPGAVLRHDVHTHPRPLAPFAVGRVALVGDAAHAVTPNLGQGGGLALEDAAVLTTELTGSGPVDGATGRYDASRRPRAQQVSALSQRVSRLAQADQPLAVALRTALLAATPPTVAAAQLARVTGWRPAAS